LHNFSYAWNALSYARFAALRAPGSDALDDLVNVGLAVLIAWRICQADATFLTIERAANLTRACSIGARHH
jgi:hypothetical protein